MDLQNPLDQLRPNHLPDPVGLWPPAIGWWLLALIGIALIVLVTLYSWRRWQKNRYRSEALLQARKIHADYQVHQSLHRLANESNELLKRVALHAFPANKVAGLNGASWNQFLADTGDMPEFLNHSAFNNHRYNPQIPLTPPHGTPDEMPANVYKLTRQWIKKHHA
ncbi:MULTISPECIES: DUF4381 domain-containing protein [Gammaproteobacteria]|uniref:DUF4381 domain-containing protein n=1 Tax=Gammaproteobacteria TaxID=1236 RepID=UPI001ADAF81B|nr:MULTISPECIES: DUF4381 domain-containing protein [Gammaproteobacteria]MBO9484436.1 DUF4381 domain-containing protein [Salinisphaera sp. G21_0]MBO9497070.1 DUF4381 domain-containing protein [Thalassotalea sp. G20_0]